VGVYICPLRNAAVEQVVTIPLLGDRPNVCSEIKPTNGFISRLVLPDFVFDTSGARAVRRREA
jgi:hypothetical protein